MADRVMLAKRLGWLGVALLLLSLPLPGQSWRFSRVYEPVNATGQFFTTTPGLDVLENDDFDTLQGKVRAALCTAA